MFLWQLFGAILSIQRLASFRFPKTTVVQHVQQGQKFYQTWQTQCDTYYCDCQPHTTFLDENMRFFVLSIFTGVIMICFVKIGAGYPCRTLKVKGGHLGNATICGISEKCCLCFAYTLNNANFLGGGSWMMVLYTSRETRKGFFFFFFFFFFQILVQFFSLVPIFIFLCNLVASICLM